jgi:hypothetical protein
MYKCAGIVPVFPKGKRIEFQIIEPYCGVYLTELKYNINIK